MSRRGSRGPLYPEGDYPNGVVFYLIPEARLPQQDCEDIVREIAVEFAQNGPFVVRVGIRPQGDMYWLGFNATECGDAFETRISIRAYKIAKQARISGPNPNPALKRALSEAEYNSYQPGGGQPEEEEPWPPEAAPAAGPPAVEYADRHHGVVFYRLDRGEIDVAIAIEAVQDIAGIMLIQMGRARPFALRYGVRQESAQFYWIGLNSTTAGVLFERTLKELAVHVTKRSKLPDGSQPLLRLVLNLPGVVIQPMPPEAAARPAVVPLPPPPPAFVPQPGPGPVEVDLEEPAAADRDRMAGVRRVNIGRMAERLRKMGRGRRGGGDA